MMFAKCHLHLLNLYINTFQNIVQEHLHYIISHIISNAFKLSLPKPEPLLLRIRFDIGKITLWSVEVYNDLHKTNIGIEYSHIISFNLHVINFMPLLRI